MDHAVILLILACELVLLDLALSIVVSMCAHNETVLSAAVHSLCIYIIVWFLILNEPTLLLPCSEVLHSLVICWLAMLVDHRIEINFWLSDVKKRFLTCLCLSLLRVEDVIRTSCYFFNILLWRTYRRKRFNTYHKFTKKVLSSLSSFLQSSQPKGCSGYKNSSVLKSLFLLKIYN